MHGGSNVGHLETRGFRRESAPKSPASAASATAQRSGRVSLNQEPAMQDAANAPPVVRFGVFEVDLRAGELRRKGVKIRLQEQPLQVLALLLQQPGQIVTREELKQKLWTGGIIVDFDHSLNTTINKLREALEDSADTPRFIETLPRRGYRFIYPVNGA